MKIYKALIPLFTFCLISCGSLTNPKVTQTTSQTYPASDPNSIEVFISKKPTKDFIEIGTVSVPRFKFVLTIPKNRPSEEILLELKQEASSIGGHAVIDYQESGDMHMTGTVIRYTE